MLLALPLAFLGIPVRGLVVVLVPADEALIATLVVPILIDPLRVEVGLGEDAALIKLGVLKHLRHFGAQAGPVVGHNTGGALLHPGSEGLDGTCPAGHILEELFALPRPHGVKVLKGQLQHGADVRAHGLQILLDLLHQEDILEPGEQGNRNVVL